MTLRSFFFSIVISFFSTHVYALNDHPKKPIYLMGMAGGLADTVIYLTQIQAMPEAQLQKRTGFLLGRAEFSRQLKDFFVRQGLPHTLCLVYFSKDLQKLQKRAQKLVKEYSADPTTLLQVISSEQFKFHSLGKISDNPAKLNDPLEEE